jgi:O-antigen ligase
MRVIENKLGLFFLTSFPCLALIIKGWTSAMLFFCLLISLFYLLQSRSTICSLIYEEFYKKYPQLQLIALAFVIPTFSILFTSLGKMQFYWHDLDGPSRYIFAITFLLFLMHYQPNIKEYFTFSITLMPIATFLLINFTKKEGWAALPRTTVYFIDPITFGSLCLSFGLLSLVLLCEKQAKVKNYLWCTLSAFCAFYLSISSMSRTGWLAIPIVIFIVLRIRFAISYFRTFLISAAAVSLVTLTLYHSSDTFHDRFNHSAAEIGSYQWEQGINATSVGERITYIRMGWDLILERPLTGWANLSMTPALENPLFSKYATASTRLGVTGGGFHNEYINNGVKFGILGMAFSVLLFLGPAIFFLQILRTQSNNRYALLAIAYITAQAISALSYQVLDFKFTASLYALMIVTLAYLAISHDKPLIKA